MTKTKGSRRDTMEIINSEFHFQKGVTTLSNTEDDSLITINNPLMKTKSALRRETMDILNSQFPPLSQKTELLYDIQEQSKEVESEESPQSVRYSLFTIILNIVLNIVF